MSVVIECYEDIKFYDYLLFDTVFLHRVNFMPVYLYKEQFYYYQYENSILLTTNRLKNDDYIPGVLDLKTYIEYINKRVRTEQFNINIDGYHHPIVEIQLKDISRIFKINKIKNR